MNKNMWMVRAGQGGDYVQEFIDKKAVGIGWHRVGDLTSIKDVEEIKQRFKKVDPALKPGQINNFSGQLFRFRYEFLKGDYVVTYNPDERVYWIGVIKSDYYYSTELLNTEPHIFPNIRDVQWLKKIVRDELSTAAKNSLGSTLTVFKIPNSTVYELIGEAQNFNSKESESERKDVLVDEEIQQTTLETLKEDIEAKALEFIQDKLTKLDWEEMQELVAGILRGMGYKTLISPKGADRGKDIMASPDGLGLENPKIIVEVKHRNGAMGGPEIRSFLAVLRQNDKGVYVSTGGFTKDARYEAERSIIPLTLIDLELLVRLLIQHYDNFDLETRALVPLKKIYWPVEV